MLQICKVFLYTCKKKEYDSSKYLQYQRQYVNKILEDVMEREFQISYSKSMVEKDKYGKPFLKDFPYIHYNISHCDGFIGCGISNNPIGIDIEKVKAYPNKVLQRAFSLNEKISVENALSKNLKFFQLWTLKESYIKGIGKGLSFPLEKIHFDIQESGGITSSQPEAHFKKFEYLIEEEQFVVSICTFQEVEIQVIHWEEGGSNE